MTQAWTTSVLANNTNDISQNLQNVASHPRRIYNPVQKDAATFLQTAEETDGEYTLMELEVAPGGGNALHYHTTFAERFTVVSGEFGVQVGKDTFTLKPGESAIAPAMSLHRWYNTGQTTAIVRVELRAGSPGFERTLQILYGLASDGLVNKQGIPKKISHLSILFEMSDTIAPGPLAKILPVLRLIAKRARSKGVERQLIERYCF